ncbi:arginine--tRNA ligase [Bacillus sp. AK128]
MFVKKTAEVLSEYISLSELEIYLALEKPKHKGYGDLSFPCFILAKKLKKSPTQIANELIASINHPYFRELESVGGYLNIFLEQETLFESVLESIHKEKEKYGYSPKGEGQKIVIDMSSPNIAKPFSMGHLRSTVIGNAISNLYEKMGYQVTKINYIGDWGTQFGKLIAAYKKWGDGGDLTNQPIKELLALYIKFHEEAEKNPLLNDEGREWFKKLEDGHEGATELWNWFRNLSLEEFERIYKLLDVNFHHIQGESFFNDKMDKVIEELNEKGLLTESEGAQIVSLQDKELPPCLIVKRDGATLYATRDLAAVLYRKEAYHFNKAIYVVGQEQSLHFKQIKEVLKKMDYEWANELIHVPFGLILSDGKKMSTRKGKIVLLDEVINEAISLAKKNIEEKNPDLQNQSEISTMIGVGAIVFHDLKHHRNHDFEFSLKEMLAFEGETGPYLQYTYARIQSLLKKGEFKSQAKHSIRAYDQEGWEAVKLLSQFPQVIEKACDDHDPSHIARFTLDLAKEFNSYYHSVKMIDYSDSQGMRLQLAYSIGVVLKECLRLLGVKAPMKM